MSNRPRPAPWRIWTARVLAIAADAVQLGFLPIFAPGAGSPAEDVLDVGVAVALTVLVGWHWTFLPAFAIELVPAVNLAPTWTGAVLVATRKGRWEAAAPAVVDGTVVGR